MQVFYIYAYSLTKEVDTMFFNKPIQVRKTAKTKANVPFLICYAIYGILIFYVLDYAAFVFIGSHPFPWIKWIGAIVKWLG